MSNKKNKKMKHGMKEFKDLFALFLDHKLLFIFGTLTLIIYVVISCLVPVFIKIIMDDFDTLPGSYGQIAYTCTVVLCLYVLSFTSFAICNVFYTFLDVKVATSLRNKIIRKFPRLPLKYFDRTKIGDTLNIAVNATYDITENLSTSLAS
jgi:ABC-type multidrug transport system fused ATPase/permease subunit